jgi:hypothetical protein
MDIRQAYKSKVNNKIILVRRYKIIIYGCGDVLLYLTGG